MANFGFGTPGKDKKAYQPSWQGLRGRHHMRVACDIGSDNGSKSATSVS
jgi:hypothetical protein